MTSPSPSGQDRESHTGSGEPGTSVGLVACESCTHPLAVHSREPGIGCLGIHWHDAYGYRCTCLRVGTSEADQ